MAVGLDFILTALFRDDRIYVSILVGYILAFVLDFDFNFTFFFSRALFNNAITSIPDSFVQGLTALQILLVLT